MEEKIIVHEKASKLNLWVLIPALPTLILLILSFNMLSAGDSNTSTWFLLTLGMTVITVIVWNKLKPLKNNIHFKNAFFNDENYENSRKFLELLNDTPPFSHINQNASTKAKIEQHQICYKENHRKLQNLISAGADIVIACGADPLLKQDIFEEIDILTPDVIIQKRLLVGVKIRTTATSVINHIIITCKNYTKLTQRREVNVATQATLGGIIGGSTGAIIGAANAIQQNAAGGEQVTTGLKAYYGLQCGFGGGTIDTIYISTSIINKIGAPPKHFVTTRTKDYWVLEDVRTAYTGNGMIGGYDETAHKECVNYIAKAIQFYFENCKYKNCCFFLDKNYKLPN